MPSQRVIVAAEELKKQFKFAGKKTFNQSDVVDMVAWVLAAIGNNVDSAEWRLLCGLKPHRD